MENRRLVKPARSKGFTHNLARNRFYGLVYGLVYGMIFAIAIVALIAPLPSFADDHGKVRMYKITKKGQLTRQIMLVNTAREGCRSTLNKRRVHRFAQIGFKYCHLFAAADCQPGSELPAMWEGKKYRSADFDDDLPQTIIRPGTDWYLHPSENVIVRSWSCHY